MGIFKSKGERELEAVFSSMKINLQNNYKEPAHNDRKKLGELADALFSEGKISEKTYKKYMQLYNEYTIKLKDYHH